MGIWLIYYNIASANRETYLHWFEGLHTDEKLARPGYDWACHYEVSPDRIPDNTDHGFIAMFGAESSRVFFDPSPAQIKPNQDDLTREMLGFRIKPMSAILTQEWCEHDAEQTAVRSVVDSEFIRLSVFAESVDDQDVGAWCAQSLFPSLSKTEQFLVGRKCLSSFGANKHIVLEEYAEHVVSDGIWQDQLNNLAFEPVTARLRTFRQ